MWTRFVVKVYEFILSPSRRREAPYEGTNSHRLFTPGETKALAKSKVHQWSWALTNGLECWVGGHHRYRRPRLLTVMYSITHATRQHEYSKWRLNRSKIIEQYREKPCFSHFTPAFCFRSRWTTFFGKNYLVWRFWMNICTILISKKTK
jgi:hypothetical protein